MDTFGIRKLSLSNIQLYSSYTSVDIYTHWGDGNSQHSMLANPE